MKKRLIVFVVAAITCLLFVVTGCTNDDNDDAKASLTPSPTTEVQESSKPSPSATVMPVRLHQIHQSLQIQISLTTPIVRQLLQSPAIVPEQQSNVKIPCGGFLFYIHFQIVIFSNP